MIKGRNLGPHHWEEVLPETLPSVNTAFFSNKHYTARAVFAFSQAFYARSFISNVADYAEYCAVEKIRTEQEWTAV